MRYTEFLLEYDRSREQARIEVAGAYQARQQQDPDFSLEQLESADPTAQKIYVPRLAIWWLAGESVEDLISTTADALAKYHRLKIKKKLKPEHADIGRFGSADQFTDTVAGYQLPGDVVPEDRGKYTEIFRDSKLLVVQLLDRTAAVFWGRGTQWCTAAQNNNQFDYYASQGPLYVILDRVNNTRYQLWWSQTDAYRFQFMDVQDKRFNPTQLPFYHQLRLIFEPLHPHLMWQTNPSLAVQLSAVRQNSEAIRWITKPTPEAQLAAVRRNPDAIRWISNPTPEVQLAAVGQDGGAIHHIQNPTPEVQLAAVRGGLSIIHIQNPTEQMQLVFVQRRGENIYHIKKPSLAVQLAAVRQRGDAIQYIKNPTPEVQLAAVGQNGYMIQYIPNPTPEVQLAAVGQKGRAIQLIPNPSLQVQLAAVEQNGVAIEYIQNPSLQVQLAAVGQDGHAIEHIPNPTPEVQLAAVRQDPGAIYWIKNPTPEVQALAVKLRKNK